MRHLHLHETAGRLALAQHPRGAAGSRPDRGAVQVDGRAGVRPRASLTAASISARFSPACFACAFACLISASNSSSDGSVIAFKITTPFVSS